MPSLQWQNIIRACVAVSLLHEFFYKTPLQTCTVLTMLALAFANPLCSEFGYGWVWFVLFASIAWVITMTLIQRTGRWRRLDLDKNLVVSTTMKAITNKSMNTQVMTYGGLIAVLMISCCVILLAASTQHIHHAGRTTPVSRFPTQ